MAVMLGGASNIQASPLVRQKKGIRFDLVIEQLLLNKALPAPLLRDIRRIYRYYACTLNCTPMTVTREMLELAQWVSDTLAQLPQ